MRACVRACVCLCVCVCVCVFVCPQSYLRNCTSDVHRIFSGVLTNSYLCRVGVLVAPSVRDHLMPCFQDLVLTFSSQLGTETVRTSLSLQRTALPHYLVLYAPALDWVLSCLAHNASESLLDSVLQVFSLVDSALIIDSSSSSSNFL